MNENSAWLEKVGKTFLTLFQNPEVIKNKTQIWLQESQGFTGKKKKKNSSCILTLTNYNMQ